LEDDWDTCPSAPQLAVSLGELDDESMVSDVTSELHKVVGDDSGRGWPGVVVARKADLNWKLNK